MDKIKIMIVEDETIVALEIKKSLIKLGFNITNSVTNYYDAIAFVLEDEPDIIIMDINLNNSRDGIETATDIKKVKPAVDILYLTAFNDNETLKRASLTNPVGYLLKPYSFEELKTTLYLAIYKKENKYKKLNYVSENIILFDEDYYFDRNSDELYYKEEKIKLTLKEVILLKILIEAKGNIVPFNVLENYVWQDELVSKGAFRTLLYRLRTKLEHKFIETFHSTGVKINITK